MKILTATHISFQQIMTRFFMLVAVSLLIIPSEIMAIEKPGDSTVKEAQPRDARNRPEKAEKGRKRGKDGRGRGANFKSLDTNADGFLSFEEFSASERLASIEEKKRRLLFNFLDRNKDGKLQEKESKPRDQNWVTSIQKNFNRLDIDKNGSLDMSEFRQAKEMNQKNKDSLTRLYKRLDRDKDGLIQKGELRNDGRGRPRHDLDFKKYDTNKSGGLDFSEFSELPFVGRLPDERRKQHFERVDTDSSGEITLNEIRTAHKHRPRPLHGKKDRKPERPKRPGPEQPKE